MYQHLTEGFRESEGGLRRVQKTVGQQRSAPTLGRRNLGGFSKVLGQKRIVSKTLRILGGYIKALIGIPILDIRHKIIVESGKETLELQGGKKFKSLADSLGIVI